MTGLVDLVPLAELLAGATGSREGASELALELLREGITALDVSRDDVSVAIRHLLSANGIVSATEEIVPARAAELITVCNVLAASPRPSPTSTPDRRLVLSAPECALPLDDSERLDTFILDVIRLSRYTLHIGGAFWNSAGFDMLDEVLLPALGYRHVALTIYANSPVSSQQTALSQRIDTLRATGDVNVRWFTGAAPNMFHAKFVIGDRSYGYLGTANLTSWGMQGHIEAGVELTPGQSARFVRFLGQLEVAGLLAPHPRSK